MPLGDDTPTRRLAYLMSFRVVLVSVMLAAAVALDIAWGHIDFGRSQFGRYLLLLAGAAYVLAIAYSLLLPRARDTEAFGLTQIAGDLCLTTILVHTTGGGLSAFVFLYPLASLAAAVLFFRRGALLVALAGSTLFAAVAIGGYRGILPPIPGQEVLPWETTVQEIARLVATNAAACFAVAMLGNFLGKELGLARAQVAAQELFIRDLSVLNDAIVRALPSGLITTDRQSRIRTANAAASEILGASGGLAGRALIEAAPPLFDLVARSPDQASIHRAEVSVVRDDGRSVELAVSVSPLRGQGDLVVGRVLSFQDLTELRSLAEKVRRAEHLAGIGRLSAAIAHELRNPLAAISGAIELLARDSNGAGRGAEEQQLHDIVLREVARLSKLVEDFLQYARPQPPHRAPIDLRDLVADVARMFREDAAQLGVAVAIEASREVRAEADASQLRQVLWNLLRNAAQASASGSSVEVAVRSDEGAALIAVRDRGAGLSAAARAHLFEPFFTTKEGGTGLGLAIAKRIVEEHGGTIDVDGAPGAGTTFTVRLPAVGAQTRLPAG
ncbi:MAG: ATP-binding protein [Myxococcota bacterium]